MARLDTMQQCQTETRERLDEHIAKDDAQTASLWSCLLYTSAVGSAMKKLEESGQIMDQKTVETMIRKEIAEHGSGGYYGTPREIRIFSTFV